MPETTPVIQTEDEQTKQSKRNRQNRIRSLEIIGLIFCVIAIVWFLYWVFYARFREFTDDAYVNGNLVRLMPQTSGTVTAINTDDTQLVLEGQPLVKLDNTDASIELGRASANLAHTVRAVGGLYEDVAQAKAMANIRNADLVKAQYDVDRRSGMVKARAISAEELQHYMTILAGAKANMAYAKSKYLASRALVQNVNLYQHPQVLAAEVAFKNAYINFVRTTIVSPVKGYVAKRTVQLGQQISPASALMAIVPLREVWISANYKESQLTRLRIGQDVTVMADAYGDYKFHGKIHGLSAGTGSAFDLLPPQNATGNWIKIVQRVPVRIDLDADEVQKHPLRIGLSARVTTNTSDLHGNVLISNADDFKAFSTPVFLNQLADADAMIQKIVQANSPDMTLPADGQHG